MTDSERIDIAIDPFTGRNPSYCFVDLQAKDQAERAMAELDGRDMRGRPVKIKPGVAKTAERNPDHFAMDHWRHQNKPSFAKLHSDSSKRVYVGGLPRVMDHDTLESTLKTFFQGYNVYVWSVFLMAVADSISARMLASCLPRTLPNASNLVTTTIALWTWALKMKPSRPWTD